MAWSAGDGQEVGGWGWVAWAKGWGWREEGGEERGKLAVEAEGADATEGVSYCAWVSAVCDVGGEGWVVVRGVVGGDEAAADADQDGLCADAGVFEAAAGAAEAGACCERGPAGC